jgi:hypothetical protein
VAECRRKIATGGALAASGRTFAKGTANSGKYDKSSGAVARRSERSLAAAAHSDLFIS